MKGWFKNISLFQLPEGMALNPIDLDAVLQAHPLRECMPNESRTVGWVQPFGEEDGRYVVYQDQQMLIALGTEARLLPSAVVKDAVKAKAAAIAEEQGYPPGKRQLRAIKDIVIAELMPRAFTRRSTIRCWIDLSKRMVAIDCASSKRGEDLLSVLRSHRGDMPATPISIARVAGAMTEWLARGAALLPFALDSDGELKGSEGCVRYADHSLDGADIKAHIEAGKVATRLGLAWRDRVSFVLTDKAAIKRIRPSEIIQEKEDGSPRECGADEAEFVLMAGELSRLISELLEALK